MALIGRELVEAIDQLIIIRIAEYQYDKDNYLAKTHRDDAELVKRKLTDALLEMDSRKGVYAGK
jgi:hypothetical protein